MSETRLNLSKLRQVTNATIRQANDNFLFTLTTGRQITAAAADPTRKESYRHQFTSYSMDVSKKKSCR
jgi:hypothetical protein